MFRSANLEMAFPFLLTLGISINNTSNKLAICLWVCAQNKNLNKKIARLLLMKTY